VRGNGLGSIFGLPQYRVNQDARRRIEPSAVLGLIFLSLNYERGKRNLDAALIAKLNRVQRAKVIRGNGLGGYEGMALYVMMFAAKNRALRLVWKTKAAPFIIRGNRACGLCCVALA
jgi:hypothetical protein